MSIKQFYILLFVFAASISMSSCSVGSGTTDEQVIIQNADSGVVAQEDTGSVPIANVKKDSFVSQPISLYTRLSTGERVVIDNIILVRNQSTTDEIARTWILEQNWSVIGYHSLGKKYQIQLPTKTESGLYDAISTAEKSNLFEFAFFEPLAGGD